MGEGKLTPLTRSTPLNRQSRNIAHVIMSRVQCHEKFLVSALCLLDLSAAFDTIDHNISLTRPSSCFGIHGTARFISYLSSRCFRVKCNNDFSSPHTCLCGVPKGSVLGPLLMYTIRLSTLVSSHSLNHHLYADDTTFLLLPSIRFPLQHQSLTKCSTS